MATIHLFMENTFNDWNVQHFDFAKVYKQTHTHTHTLESNLFLKSRKFAVCLATAKKTMDRVERLETLQQ